MAEYVENLLRIPRLEEDPIGPFWANDWFPPLDGASLYGLIGVHAPRRYIEVGSGISTRFARRAIRDLGLGTKIISIDPHPHTTVDTLCDEVMRCRMEDVPRDFWDRVEPDDMLFVDNSRRSFPNSRRDRSSFRRSYLRCRRAQFGACTIFCSHGTIRKLGISVSTMNSTCCLRIF